MIQPQPRHRNTVAYVGVAAMAALAAILWYWNSTQPDATLTDKDPQPTDSQQDRNASALGIEIESGQRVSATPADDGVRTLRVQDASGSPIAGAQALIREQEAPIGISNAAGELRLALRLPETDEIHVRAAGYWPQFLEPRSLAGEPVVTLRARPGHTLAILVVTETGAPAASIDISLARAGTESTEERRSARTDDSGHATLPGLGTGDYQAMLKMGEIDVTGFLQDTTASIRVPCEGVKWVLHLPRVAWVKPDAGRIVTGYFRAPMGKADFGRTHRYLRGVEQSLRRIHDSSLAQAFTSPTDEVTFIGLLDPGGWTVQTTPVAILTLDMVPTPIRNAELKPIEYGQLTVEATTIDGKPIQDAPFALRMASAGKYGSFTMPISVPEPQKLPVGKYVFVALQAGAAALFDGPQQAIQITRDCEKTVHVRATKEVRRVRIQTTQTTKEGDQLPVAGIVRITDGNAFQTEFLPGSQDTVWLPTGLPLQARTRRHHHISYIDLACDFFVPATGAPELTLNLTEQP